MTKIEIQRKKEAKGIQLISNNNLIGSIWFIQIIAIFTILFVLVSAYKPSNINDETTYISTILQLREYNGIEIYQIDLMKYIRSVESGIKSISTLTLEKPQMYFGIGLVNRLINLTNWLLLIINFLLYPLRLGGYLVLNVMAILGINTLEGHNHGLSWLINFANTLKDFTITYFGFILE